MFALLLKKQLMQYFRSYLYNTKKNSARSKASIVGMFVFFFFVMVVILGGSFYGMAMGICYPLVSEGLGWIYYVIMALISLLLGVLGSVFTTYSSLYLAKDNDLLLSMPIPVKYIVASRLVGVYLMGLMYSSVVIVPAVIVYWQTASFGAMTVLGGICIWLCISIIVMVLSCLLGWVVAKISLKIKNKSAITTIAALVLFALYYVLYFRAMNSMEEFIANVASFDGRVHGATWVLYFLGRGAEGDVSAMLICLAFTAAMFALMWTVLKSSFLNISTATGAVSKNRYQERKAVLRSADSALLSKELGRFTSSPNYMLNCALGSVMLIAAGIAILIKGAQLNAIIDDIGGLPKDAVIVIIGIGICTISAMNDIAAPSVSLEGKSIWLPQSLPVEPWRVLLAKLRLQLYITAVPMLFCALCAVAVLPGGILDKFAFVAVCLTSVLLGALWCLYLGVKTANLNWVNETMPIKQSGGVFLALLGGIIYAIAFAALYFIVEPASAALHFGLFVVIDLILSAILYLWLKNRGTKLFMEL